MPPPRLPRKPLRLYDRTKDKEYAISSWRFQKFLVRLFLIPFPFALGLVAYWFIWEHNEPVPLTYIAVLLSSVAGTLSSAFFFWRCPQCNSLLFRTSETEATELFWLADPEHCPDCGVRLRSLRTARRANRNRFQ